MVTGRQRDATKAAQQYMAVHSTKPLIADGRWGSYTQSAYNATPPAARIAVDQILASFGTSASALRAEFAAEKLANPNSKLQAAAERAKISKSTEAMQQLVRDVAIAEGVPPETALRICYLESKFDPNAKSPTGAKGLFQMTSVAVKDLMDPTRSPDPFDLRGKEYDPLANAIAGCRYIKIVAKDMRVPLTNVAAVYMGFNIGSGAARKYLAGDTDRSVARLINMQAYGPPSVYGRNLRAAVDKAGERLA